jgi:hypothetical protein
MTRTPRDVKPPRLATWHRRNTPPMFRPRRRPIGTLEELGFYCRAYGVMRFAPGPGGRACP